MIGEEADTGSRTCPCCGIVLEESLAEQFFCEYCGSPLVEEERHLSVLPDWVQDVPAVGDPDGLSADQDGLAPARIELHPTGATQDRRSAARPQTGVSCVLVVGIAMFLAAVCVLGWVVFSIFRVSALEPASWLTVSRVATVSAGRGWQYTGVRVREGQVVSIRYLDGTWGIWGGPRAVEQLVGAAGFPGEYRSLGLPLDSAPAGSLIGRIGKGAIFHVGTHTRFRSAERGRLELTINDHWLEDNIGAVRVEIEVLTGQ